jgi:hypothetical protein
MIGQSRQHVREPCLGVNAAQLGSFDQGVDRGCPLATAVGAGEGSIAPADGHAAQGSLGRIVNGHDAIDAATPL